MSRDSGIATIYRFLHRTRIQELRLSIGAKVRDIFRVRILVWIIHKKYKNKNKPYRLHLDWCIGSDCVFSWHVNGNSPTCYNNQTAFTITKQ